MHAYVRVDAETPGGWRATLALTFGREGERTVLARRVHSGPLTVQRPFHPEGYEGACHVYLLHPPGGVVGGDVLDITVHAGPDSRALITTPAANKLYRSAGPRAQLAQTLHVDAGAQLEWLPQPTIAFAGVHARVATRVNLAPGGSFIGWEILCLGRPDSGERYDGTLGTALELWQDGAPMWLERARYDGQVLLDAPFGLRGQCVSGTLLATPVVTPDRLDAVRATLALHDTVLTGASMVDDVLALRVLGFQTETVQRALTAAWAALRPLLMGRPALPPRIWAT
ncbi:urease accessory protein UreD [Immundisolibacter sp.]|uniref:urease accessory protein UreD n=1 Tax=Immundisolibacter sp. TaxID=1934948 RepID=UPI003568FC45